MKLLLRMGIVTAALAVIWSARDAASARAAAPVPVTACNPSMVSRAVAVSGTISGILIDDTCQHVYLTHTNLNRVEVYSLQALSFEAPIQVGAQPAGLDMTPDGTLLYVANTGGTNISVVDVAQRVELRKINVPPGSSTDKPFSIAIANSGRALFSTTFLGSGFGGRIMQLLLATDVVSQRTDFGIFGGSTTENTRLSASGDRSVIGIVQGDNSPGPVFRYNAAPNTFSAPRNLGTFVSDISLDMTGSTMFVTPGGFVLDANMNNTGTVVLGSGVGGNAVDPTSGIAYRAVASRLDVVNLSTFLKIGELPLGGTVNTAALFNFVGRMDISADGKLLAVITDTGFSLVRPTPPAQPYIDIVKNGTFSNGLTDWLTFATPDPSYLVKNVVAGVLEYYRQPPPAGTTNQAVVFQETGMGLSSGAPIFARFDLGNSSSVRKRISVLVLDANFTDLHVCTFWLPPNQPLKTYSMQTHTTQPWSNAAIYFYAASEGSAGGAYQIDNVSLRYDPDLFNDWTDCVDPNTPVAPGGPDGPDLIVNGGFSTGTPPPWSTFGTIAWRVLAGVFEFTRPNATEPAGVVLQATNQPMAANDILVSVFALGNNSAVRKRVTAILHDNNFSDLAACTFWVPPGQSLQPYAVATFASQAWGNATISFYAATIGSEQWTRLDSVSLQRVPSLPVTGTSCFEPTALVEPPGPVATRTPRAARQLASLWEAASAAEAKSPNAVIAAGALPPEKPQEIEMIDLTGASVTSARLTFESLLPLADARGQLQVSTDGVIWQTAGVIPPSDDWQAVEADLAPWMGRRIAVRFVLDRNPVGDPRFANAWKVRHVRLEIDGRTRGPR